MILVFVLIKIGNGSTCQSRACEYHPTTRGYAIFRGIQLFLIGVMFGLANFFFLTANLVIYFPRLTYVYYFDAGSRRVLPEVIKGIDFCCLLGSRRFLLVVYLCVYVCQLVYIQTWVFWIIVIGHKFLQIVLGSQKKNDGFTNYSREKTKPIKHYI